MFIWWMKEWEKYGVKIYSERPDLAHWKGFLANLKLAVYKNVWNV